MGHSEDSMQDSLRGVWLLSQKMPTDVFLTVPPILVNKGLPAAGAAGGKKAPQANFGRF
jgi:hypothetical protein